MFSEGRQIGQYNLIRRLGRGGFGEVWLAVDRGIAGTPPVAIKFPKGEDVDWQAVVQEIGLWVLCGRHPNVLPLIEARNYGGQIAIVSEYAPDGSLRDLLTRQRVLPPRQAVEMMIGVLDGLAHLHSGGIIHRDLKPENILLREGAPRLADFGISRVMTSDSFSQTVTGTCFYMAPEAFDGKRNAQTDLWSAGVTLYELLKGVVPFPQRELTALVGAIMTADPEPLPDSIPPGLREVTVKALAKRPDTRYRTAEEMRRALHDFLLTIHRQGAIITVEETIRDGEATGGADQTVPVIWSEETAESLRLIPYRKGNRWGFCDDRKNILVEPKYLWVRPFSEGLAAVSRGGKCGYINCVGVEVIPPRYHSATPFSEGFAEVKLADKWGFIDKSGRELTPIKYDGTQSFREGMAKVEVGERYGFINNSGREVSPIKYDNYDPHNYFSGGLAKVAFEKKYGFIDKTGREAIPLIYDYAGSFSEGLAFARVGDQGSFIDQSGEEALSLDCSLASGFSEGLAAVSYWGKVGFIDRSGEEVIPRIYESTSGYHCLFKEGLAAVRVKNKYGFIDKSGDEVIPFRYGFALGFCEARAWVVVDKKWGYIDKFGREVIPIKYDNAEDFRGGMAQVILGGQYCYVTPDGAEYCED